jgi:hypothetical protein
MKNLDTIAQLQLDDNTATLRRHVAGRSLIRSIQRAASSAPAAIGAQPDGCESSAARRTAAQRPAV